MTPTNTQQPAKLGCLTKLGLLTATYLVIAVVVFLIFLGVGTAAGDAAVMSIQWVFYVPMLLFLYFATRAGG